MIRAMDVANPSTRVAPRVQREERLFRELLERVGIEIGGANPWDVRVRDPGFYTRVLRGGSLGLGESYVDGAWECDALDQCIDRILRGQLDRQFRSSRSALVLALRARVINPQAVRRAFEVGRRHYDIGNDLYEAMLDRRMIYSCAYWRSAGDLEAAQTAKLELVCRKLELAEGMRVLDLGCGWGGFARYAAQTRGVSVVGVTVSEEQAKHAALACSGLPVEIRLEDYRAVRGRFDRVVALGVLEHVGPRNYAEFMAVIERALGGRGAALIQTVAGNRSLAHGDPWLDRYIFPNSSLPSMAQIAAAMEMRLVLEDVHNFGPDYDRTLMAWYANFERAWPSLRARYGEPFRRMWRYYLLSCAGGFRARSTQLLQIVATPVGAPQPDPRAS
jgi:cyclopropane-fatty-acyl-phospholipid synthase